MTHYEIGEVPEWSNGAVSKTVVLATVPRVRIPVSPPKYFPLEILRLVEVFAKVSLQLHNLEFHLANFTKNNNKHYVRDPVHDLIEFAGEGFEQMLWSVVQTSTFQRLRRIRQLGFCELVYPGATHNRFEHSLGVFHNARRLNIIAKQLLGNNHFDQERAEVSMAAALLHDVGHGPFSHSFEALGERVNLRYGKHEDLSDEIIRKSEISGLLNDYRSGFANLIADMVAGNDKKDIFFSNCV